ncbi:toll-like receptor 4 [Haliotis asinina]|uniref:toll-like receptor 4 n=1 Tax=Haliotis asinina TaxID=109174 RepID=UPI0035326E96
MEEDIFDFYPPTLERLSIVDNRFTVGAYVYNIMKAKGLKSLDMSDMSITHHFFWEFTKHLRRKRHLHQMFYGPPDLENLTVRNYEMKYRWRLRYLYYVARDRYRPLRASEGGEHEFVYDAFVCSSDEDSDFVDKLVGELEGQGRRLCIHHRDFKPGEPITSNIVKAVQTSRRTLIILSPNFLSSEWCRYEFEMAKMEGVYEARSVILIVKIGEVDAQSVPRELLYMMKTDSYTEYPENPEDQATFWTSLSEAITN